jgi:hypothetical protein
MPVTIRVNLGNVVGKLDAVRANIHNNVMISMAEWLRDVIRGSFSSESSAEKVPWKPLSPLYAARKEKGARILEFSGALFEQSTRGPIISGNTITASSTLPYAAVHQDGFSGEEECPRIHWPRAFGQRVREAKGPSPAYRERPHGKFRPPNEYSSETIFPLARIRGEVRRRGCLRSNPAGYRQRGCRFRGVILVVGHVDGIRIELDSENGGFLSRNKMAR